MARTSCLFRGSLLAAGWLLLAAAGLKVIGGSAESWDQTSLHLLSPTELLAVEAETVVGLWAISGWWPRAAWVTVLTLFFGLAGVSLYQAVDGQVSCGCFGRVDVHPWWTFTLDVVISLALWAVRPRRHAPTDQSDAGIEPLPRARLLIRVGTCAATIAGCGLLFLVHEYGSVRATVATLAGVELTADPAQVPAGAQPSGTQRIVTVSLRNESQESVRIVGSRASCSKCLAVADLPVVIPPGGAVTVPIHVRFRGPPRSFRERVLFYTDSPRHPFVRITVAGAVAPPAGER